jgi:hypothetical protein
MSACARATRIDQTVYEYVFRGFESTLWCSDCVSFLSRFERAASAAKRSRRALPPKAAPTSGAARDHQKVTSRNGHEWIAMNQLSAVRPSFTGKASGRLALVLSDGKRHVSRKFDAVGSESMHRCAVQCAFCRRLRRRWLDRRHSGG